MTLSKKNVSFSECEDLVMNHPLTVIANPESAYGEYLLDVDGYRITYFSDLHTFTIALKRTDDYLVFYQSDFDSNDNIWKMLIEYIGGYYE